MITTEIEIFNVLLLAALALIFARILGYLFCKIKQPVVIGEILAGVVLGGIVVMLFSGQEFFIFDYKLPMPNLNFSSEVFNPFELLAELGILFLLFISGLEVNISKLKKMGKTSSLVAIGGVTIPLVMGTLTGLLLGFGHIESIAIGLILTATSVGVTVRTLMDLRVLDSDVGTAILGGAVIDDMIGIILLAFVMGIESLTIQEAVPTLIWICVKIAIFFLIFLILGLKVIDKVLGIGEKIQIPRALLSITLAILLIYSFFADKAGISGIIGAFVAGMLIGHNIRSRKIIADIKTIGYGFFIPIFFVWVGFSLWNNHSTGTFSIVDTLLLASVLIIIGIVGKICGCGLGAKISGMTNRESLQIGVGMVPRMELALIIATAAASHGILTGSDAQHILIATILLTIVTTLIAPILIKASFKKH